MGVKEHLKRFKNRFAFPFITQGFADFEFFPMLLFVFMGLSNVPPKRPKFAKF